MSGLRINSGKSGTRNRENVSIRSIAESTRVCVKLKAVTEIIGAVRVIYIYYLWDWEPVDRLKHSTPSSFRLFSFVSFTSKMDYTPTVLDDVSSLLFKKPECLVT